MRIAALLGATVTLWLGACAPAPAPPAPPAASPAAKTAPATPANTAPRATPAAATPVSPPPAVSINPAAQPAVDGALRAAANQLGVPAAQLQVVRVEPREWPDTSLGCPRPGMMYAQVITPGYLVVIDGAGRQLEFHTNARGDNVVLCRDGQP